MSDRVFDPATLLSSGEREAYEERAAIRELSGGLSRFEAEREALQDVLRLRPRRQADLFVGKVGGR